jgi:hypothetical protein
VWWHNNVIAMADITATEFSRELDVLFADLLAKGRFELVEASLHQPHNAAKVIYASPTCLLKFERNTYRGPEWDIKMARQPREDEKPKWIAVGLILQFLKNETPEETLEILVHLENTRNSQIPLKEYVEWLLPYNIQIIEFFELKGFEERWKSYEKYIESHIEEVSHLRV